MARHGLPDLIDLNTQCDGMVKSYLQQVAEGQRRDGEWSRLRYLVKANYAHLYINRLRRHSNEARYLNRASDIERRLLQPWHRRPTTPSARAAKYDEMDYYVERGAIPLDAISALRDDLMNQPVYYDPYQNRAYRGRPEESGHPLLYMDSQTLFTNPHFLRICANPQIIAFCREVLGPRAALSWGWSWISNPTRGQNYQTQNWHRDISEPLNFVRVFVPLQDIAGFEDGPTALVLGSSKETTHREAKRFSDGELSEMMDRRGAGVIQADAGDVYFINTMALHRGVAPTKQRAILTMLVSLSPSHRTPSILKLKRHDLPEDVREAVEANRSFFRYLVR